MWRRSWQTLIVGMKPQCTRTTLLWRLHKRPLLTMYRLAVETERVHTNQPMWNYQPMWKISYPCSGGNRGRRTLVAAPAWVRGSVHVCWMDAMKCVPLPYNTQQTATSSVLSAHIQCNVHVFIAPSPCGDLHFCQQKCIMHYAIWRPREYYVRGVVRMNVWYADRKATIAPNLCVRSNSRHSRVTEWVTSILPGNAGLETLHRQTNENVEPELLRNECGVCLGDV